MMKSWMSPQEIVKTKQNGNWKSQHNSFFCVYSLITHFTKWCRGFNQLHLNIPQNKDEKHGLKWSSII